MGETLDQHGRLSTALRMQSRCATILFSAPRSRAEDNVRKQLESSGAFVGETLGFWGCFFRPALALSPYDAVMFDARCPPSEALYVPGDAKASNLDQSWNKTEV